METAKPRAMTSRQRVLAALRREPVDRTPVCNPTSVATVELMDLADAYFPEANRNPELMARLAATGHTELGFDSIMPVFSIIQESSALGCKIQWEQKDNWPTVKMREPIWQDADDIRIPNVGKRKRLGVGDCADRYTCAAEVLTEPSRVLLLLVLVDAVHAQPVGEALARQQYAQ